MESLLSYLLNKYVCEETPLSKELTNCKPLKLDLSKLLHDTNGPFTRMLTPQSFQQLQFLLAKNIVTYSPSQLEVKLNVKNVIFYQRIYKLKHFVSKQLKKEFSVIFDKFIDSELMPISLEKKTVDMLYGENNYHREKEEVKVSVEPVLIAVKGKKKKEEEVREKKEEPLQVQRIHENKVDYSRVIYEYSGWKEGKESTEVKEQPPKRKNSHSHFQEEISEYLINLQEVSEMYFYWVVQKCLQPISKELKEQIKSTHGKQIDFTFSWLEMYLVVKQNRPLKPLLLQIINKAQDRQIQNYILQLFSKYDVEQSDEEGEEEEGKQKKKPRGRQPEKKLHHPDLLNKARNALLTYNLLRKYPYLTEKELAVHCLLSTTEMRTCLNLLVREGLVAFFQQTPRSMIYKASGADQLQKLLVKGVAQSILNVYHLLDNTSNILRSSEGEKGKKLTNEQMVKFQVILARLDDQLILFGY